MNRKTFAKPLSAIILLSGAVSTGVVSAQEQSGAAMGGMNNGAMNNSGMMAMQPRDVTGILLRHYVDVTGNVTAMDLKTAEGVRQVRFSPVMLSTDERLQSFRKGSPVTVNGTVSMGLTSYDPNGPLGSGLLMDSNSSNVAMTGAASSPTTGSMSTGTGGVMAGGWSYMLPRGTDLSGVNFDSAAQLAMSPIRAIVHLPDGRASIIREWKGRMVFLSPDNHTPTEVTLAADGTMGEGSTGLPTGARVMMTGTQSGTMSGMTSGTAGTMNGGMSSGGSSGATTGGM
ncbi:MAG TPA: hypothetical protein VF681_02765 [Abditibacteriaceae bacterium]|jgi:hypothetical protein